MKTLPLFVSQKKIAFSFLLEEIDFSISQKTKYYKTVTKSDIDCNYDLIVDKREIFLDCICNFVVKNQFESNLHVRNAFYNVEELMYLNINLVQQNTKIDAVFILSDKN